MEVQSVSVKEYLPESVMILILLVALPTTYSLGGIGFASFALVSWFVFGIWLYEALKRL